MGPPTDDNEAGEVSFLPCRHSWYFGPGQDNLIFFVIYLAAANSSMKVVQALPNCL